MNRSRAKRTARNRLMCLVGAGVFLAISAPAIYKTKATDPSEAGSLTTRSTAFPPPSRGTAIDFHADPVFDDFMTICSTQFSQPRDKRIADPCFLGSPRNRARPARMARPFVIDVYFHILTTRTGEGAVPRNVLEHQVRILNEAFAGNGVYGIQSPFQFRLMDPDTRQNDDWFQMEYSERSPTPAEREAKRALNKPGNSTLNIYTAGIKTHGWARWPWQLADRIDGVVVRYSTLPGGTADYYNTGDVVVHEVGHWLGLFHTSHGGCNTPGDCVEDTTPEAYAKTDCNTTDDSCSGGAADPYWNLMNYTYDKCRYLFTRGQIFRAEAIFRKYRI